MDFETETPYNFIASRRVGRHLVEYRQLCEACQGGVELGFLYVDDIPVDRKHEFGGPPFSDGEFLYVPRFQRGGLFSKQGFSICRVDLNTKETVLLTQKHRFRLPHKREGNRIFFYENFPQKHEGFIDLPADNKS
jgi:hypothetical protein